MNTDVEIVGADCLYPYSEMDAVRMRPGNPWGVPPGVGAIIIHPASDDDLRSLDAYGTHSTVFAFKGRVGWQWAHRLARQAVAKRAEYGSAEMALDLNLLREQGVTDIVASRSIRVLLPANRLSNPTALTCLDGKGRLACREVT
jgi:hypothetical protein